MLQRKKSPVMKRHGATHAGSSYQKSTNFKAPHDLTNLLKADDFSTRGLTPTEVELEHLRAIVTQIKLDRTANESLVKDNALLKEKLGRAEEFAEFLEQVSFEKIVLIIFVYAM